MKAKLELEAARFHLQSVKSTLSGSYGADGAYAYARAIKGESDALIEYSRTLRIYTDLVVHGKLPDNEERQPPSGDEK